MLVPLALALAQPADISFSAASLKGVTASFAGVPVIQGSWFQYVEPGWSKTHFRSSINPQKVEKLPNGDYKLTFKSSNSLAFGSQTIKRTENGLVMEWEFFWEGASPVQIELTAAALWAPSLQHGTLFVDGHPTKQLSLDDYDENNDIALRTYGTNFKSFVFDAPFGRLSGTGNASNWTAFDGRNYNQNWAVGKELYWLGVPNLVAKSGQPAKASLELTFEPKNRFARKAVMSAASEPLPQALFPRDLDVPIIPRPKQALLDKSDPMVLNDSLQIDVPDRLSLLPGEFVHDIQTWWQAPNLKAEPNDRATIFARIQDLNLPAEGYEIRINRNTATVMGQDENGLRHAFRTLAQLVFAKNGKLCIPSGTIRDWPSVAWRGVHVFGGPNALEFQKRMGSRVIAPLKLNKVVFQCERTNWLATPGIETDKYSRREDLKRIFEMYRLMGVEPIPLIQSFGHMTWLFMNGQNLDIAMDKEAPFAIDPRKPRSREVLNAVWEEAIELLKPKTIHFGLDEVDTRGFKKDPELVSQLWETHVPFLNGIAAQHGIRPMFWGDKALAPGEAIDAALGDSAAHALRRRNVFPKGSIIGDWHYRNEPRADLYMNSLRLWKNAELFPVASTWFRHENIQGFYLAAYRAGAGTLQTIWAGHEHNEDAMLKEFRQFAAIVVAADYAWSGRMTRWNELDYVPEEVFGRMFFSDPSPTSSIAGVGLQGTRFARIGDVNFRIFNPISLVSGLSSATSSRPSEVELNLTGLHGTKLALALDATTECSDGDPVADLEIKLSNGKVVKRSLFYGRHVRALADQRVVAVGPRNQGLTAYKIDLADVPVDVQSITLKATSTYAGLRLQGATAY